MLLQFENTDHENVDKLLTYAHQNNLQLSVIDNPNDSYFLPGKPLSPQQLTALTESSRQSGLIKMEDAHSILYKAHKAH